MLPELDSVGVDVGVTDGVGVVVGVGVVEGVGVVVGVGVTTSAVPILASQISSLPALGPPKEPLVVTVR